jgi:SAM-dependent methyltransferase
MICLFFSFRFCQQVIGIDVSANQIAQAQRKHNIEYRCHSAEDLSFLSSNSVDLITVATAIHWFNIESFFQQVQRVLKCHTGVVAVWTYTLGRLNNVRADEIYQEFHHVHLRTYWNSKGALALDAYQSILPLFPYSSTREVHSIDHCVDTTIEQFLGFIQSLSACQTYRQQQGEQAYVCLIDTVRHKLIECYRHEHDTSDGNSIAITVTHPLRLYLMRKT